MTTSFSFELPTKFFDIGTGVLLMFLVSAGPIAAGEAAKGADDQRGEETAEMELDGRDGRPLALDRFRPSAMLQVEQHRLTSAKFGCVDVHTHLRFKLRDTGNGQRLDEFVKLMDAHNIEVCVSLDGGIGERFTEHARFLWSRYPRRFVIFANLDWRGSGRSDEPATWDCQRPDFARRMAAELAKAKEQGCSGLKLFKSFGLSYRNPDGSLIEIDDERWDPIWAACGKLGLVVLMHTADPAAFFLPIDETNERWEELHRHPDWSFYGDQWPSRDELLAARNRVIARHTDTKFIGAHFANNPEDLATVGRWLDEYPNLYIEFSSRIAELGRQPYTSRKFFLKYADRIMHGTDGPWPAARLAMYWRFLETYDEYLRYSEKPFPPQGFWRIYGLGLPDVVLRKVYFENAARLIPGVQDKLSKQRARPRSTR